jgi:DNA-binding FadR family transcriptional regulator
MLHTALARMSGNQLFISVLESVYYNIHTYYENYLPRGKKILQENFGDLRAIVAAVTARDAEGARELAREHVRRFNAYMEEKET